MTEGTHEAYKRLANIREALAETARELVEGDAKALEALRTLVASEATLRAEFEKWYKCPHGKV